MRCSVSRDTDPSLKLSDASSVAGSGGGGSVSRDTDPSLKHAYFGCACGT